MGYAISSFLRALGALTTHPKLFVGIGATATAGAIGGFVLGQIPLVGAILSGVLVTPLVLAAVTAMALGGVRGAPEYGQLMEGIEDHWQPMVGAYGILFAAYFAAAFALGIVLVALFFAVGMSASGGSDGGGMLPVALGGGLFLLLAVAGLLVLVVALFVQFLDVAVVVGGADALEAFRVCWRVVRAEPVSVIGYSLLRFVVAVVPVWIAWIVGFVLSGAAVGANDGGAGFLLVLVVPFLASLVVVPFVTTVASVYHVAFFDSLDEQYAFISSENRRPPSAD